MFTVRLIEDENVEELVYGIITQGDSTFFLVWNNDRGWHYINSDKYRPQSIYVMTR